MRAKILLLSAAAAISSCTTSTTISQRDLTSRHLPLVVLWIAVGAVWIASTAFMATVPLSGDELFYSSGAKFIAGFLTGDITFAEMKTNVVGFGWFTPGVPIVLTPLFLFDATPHVSAVRIYAGALALILWFWSLWEVNRAFGRQYTLALLVFPTLDVTWQLFSATIWGDLPAGLLLVIVFVRTWTLGCRNSPSPRDIIALELILAAAFYLRGSLLVVAVAVNVFLLALPFMTGQWRSGLHRAAVLALGSTVFAAVVAPWSAMASRELGGTVISTSTPALSFGITFGKADRLCFGPCPGKNIWIEGARFSQAYGAANGISELEAQKRMATNATRDLTLKEYTKRVRRNLKQFLLVPTGFVRDRFLPGSRLELPDPMVSVAGTVAAFWTGLLYFPALLALILANGIVVTGRAAQIESLCIKMFTLCLFVQPFIHPSHSRYWPTLGPLMALSAAFLLKMIATRSSRDGALSLVAMQWLYVAGAGGVLLAVLLV
ncbi:hypothetical protein [Chelativorans alearense]|uniref:hypothetical protein n=1 Tax=Chelativorans alearense TaxID=2681495 RepID=UPI0013D5F292|nr:hypothetical protein [Chelativorans alearense]